MKNIQFRINFGADTKGEKKNTKKRKWFWLHLVNRNSPYTNTISARYYKDGSEILVQQKGKLVKITPREAARLQGFPEEYIIPVSDTQSYKQFGNSVGKASYLCYRQEYYCGS